MNSAYIPDTNTALVAGRKVEDAELASLADVVNKDAHMPKRNQWRFFLRKSSIQKPKEKDKAQTPPAAYWELYKYAGTAGRFQISSCLSISQTKATRLLFRKRICHMQSHAELSLRCEL